MHKGCYRYYFKLPFVNIGIKFVRIESPKEGSFFEKILAGIIMNLKERARYKYYVLKKPMWNWGKKWYWGVYPHKDESSLAFNPTYFSCGIFNIVKHQPKVLKNPSKTDNDYISDNELIKKLRKWTGYIVYHDLKYSNFAIDENNKYVAIDYGDFKVEGYNNDNVGNIDYA